MPKRLNKQMKCIECGREYTATYISGSKPRRTCGVECQGELARRRGILQAEQAKEFYLKRESGRCIAN